ncbi:F0F1 ATP synthase subunit epsilon [Mangrovimonas sp. AS39]|uniref:F0F1 ATP synthase subunit epsilon n=1 Tax=Mangrovimonas TaxID=1211036 RepID=UPI0006B60AA6|nr:MULTISPECIES: F0F1 ATP synthase subunit epsilon [Mangrovimonas]MCF1190523.1 F0F1 ATP synthase subunit epsilon [Mangrovimonas futianensis]MCF1193725.1 F0F1 ATP synthase subunit epsilon [Mangrovimonas futianensis]MCF1420690.1 F0F1 ATP synthase subunit epsilon [Mangrovimonas futianensis]NIK91071.1 F0F1 ATP synthase subunit epsilon [Mangrovimonas sp. CR14]
MYLEIVSPEATIFSSEVDSVVVPGAMGEFQMLNNHAPIVSLLKEGTIKIHTHSDSKLVYDELHGSLVPEDKLLKLKINSGTLEMKDNKAIILVE